MARKRSQGHTEAGPMTAEALLRMDNIPASAPMPEEMQRDLAERAMLITSSRADFDPRQHFTQVKGWEGAWRAEGSYGVREGIPVREMKRVKPGSLRSLARRSGDADAYRPPWQPHIYHPKMALGADERQLLRRKSGALVRPHIVFNNDDRATFSPQGYPWHCVGRVFVRTPESGDAWKVTGTGTLVGPRAVLTSGHLIPWGRSDAMIKFVPGYFAGQSVVGAGVQSWVTNIHGYNAGQRQAWDLAVMRLEEPMGVRLGTFGAKTYDDDWEDDPRWTLVGYPGEINVTMTWSPIGITSTKTNGEFPTRQFGISVEDDDSDGDALEVEHHGDSTDGNSGGPLFGDWPKGPYVIGVESGGQTAEFLTFTLENNNVAAGGNAMVDLVKWARANWP
jgi:V8-like Glu-specific endopeptidase